MDSGFVFKKPLLKGNFICYNEGCIIAGRWIFRPRQRMMLNVICSMTGYGRGEAQEKVKNLL